MADDYSRLIESASCGNAEAADFLMMIAGIAQTWDDLIDRDKAVQDIDINTAFEAAIINIPMNRFYQRHSQALTTLIHNAIRNWHLATRIEREGPEILYPAAFVLRSAYADIFAHVAYIMGGEECALTVALEARRQAHSEGLDGYVKNLAAEVAARGG